MPTETITKQLTGLTQGTEYEYRVIALGDGTTYTDSDPSTTASFTTLIKLATPSPTLWKDTDTIRVSWATIQNATSYVVAYKQYGAQNFTEDTVSAPDHSYDLDNLAEGATYIFKVKAVSSQTTVYEESDFSSEVSETTQTTLATPVPTIARTINSLEVSWSAINNADGYVVAYKTGSDDFTEVAVTGETSYLVPSLAEGVTYVFKVKATTNSTSYASSGFSAEITGTTKITLGTPVFTLSKTTSSITATWTAINNATGYTIAYKTGSGNYTEDTIPASGNATDSYTLPNLNEGDTYTFKVKATSSSDNYVESSYSGESSATTLVTLATPTGIVVSGITTNSATITWNGVEHNSGYRLEYRRKGDTEWTPVNVSGD